MNVIRDYALSHLKENKRNSIFIFIAIMIASTLICAVGALFHSEWLYRIDSVIDSNGNWHGYFTDAIKPEQLKYVQQNPEVDAVLVKDKERQTLQLSGTKRPYISMTRYDADSWKDMPVKKRLLEGRLPVKSGEIAVSKLFFSDNPQFKIGDTLALPAGQRVLNGKKLNDSSIKLDGEAFQPMGKQTVTIVGSLDLSSISAFPCYIAYGFLDMQNSLPNDLFTVYVRLKHISKVFEVFPQMAESIGLESNSEGKYNIRYNADLLALKGVEDRDIQSNSFHLSGLVLLAILLAGLIMFLFIILIYNAYTVSSASQMKQLGILKSIGATPKQIRYCVLYEAFLLACIAVPLGIVLGYGSIIILFKAAVSILNDSKVTQPHVVFSWLVVLASSLASFLTVLFSAWIPAKRLAKLLPIEAIRNPSVVKIKKSKGRRLIPKWSGFTGELAFNAFAANKRAFVTTLISLTLFVTILCSFQSFTTIWMMDQKLELAQKQYTLDMTVTVTEESDDVLEELSGIQGVQKQAWFRGASNSMIWDEKNLSPDFLAVGGFQSNYIYSTNLESDGGKNRIHVVLQGLDHASFIEYCKQIGADPRKFGDSAEHKGIVVNNNRGNVSSIIDQYKIPETDYLDLAVGDALHIEEKCYSGEPLTGKYSITVVEITRQYPKLEENYYPSDLVIVVPMETYEDVVKGLTAEIAMKYQIVSYKMSIPREQLAEAQQKANSILNEYLPKEDWDTTSLLDEEDRLAKDSRPLALMVVGFAIFLGLVGISGVFSAVAGNLSARRREFSVLRSTGLTPQGINRMFLVESLFFGFFPLLFSLPILIGLCSILIHKMNRVTWGQFMIHAPWGYLILCMILVVGSVWLAYQITGVKIKKQNIIEAIKDETK